MRRKLPDFLTDGEYAALIRVPNKRYPTGLRNLLILEIMGRAGLRVGEVIRLHTSDVDLNTGKLMVREGKGKKDRALWLGEDVLALLQKWREIKPRASLMFTTLGGSPLNARYLREMVRRVATRAGIDKHVHPHMLRHTFATKLYKETKDIRLVQKALGHSDLSTTMIYTHVVDDALEAAMRAHRVDVQ